MQTASDLPRNYAYWANAHGVDLGAQGLANMLALLAAAGGPHLTQEQGEELVLPMEVTQVDLHTAKANQDLVELVQKDPQQAVQTQSLVEGLASGYKRGGILLPVLLWKGQLVGGRQVILACERLGLSTIYAVALDKLAVTAHAN